RSRRPPACARAAPRAAMIVPTRRAVVLLAAGFPVALLPALVAGPLWPAWAAVLAGALATMAAELLLATAPERVAVEARLPEALYVGGRDVLGPEVRAGARTTRFDLVCDFDDTLVEQPAVRLAAGPEPATAEVPLVPRRRGTAAVRAVWLGWRGPFGLLQWTEERPLGRSIP